MADVKIQNLLSATTVADTDLFIVVDELDMNILHNYILHK